MTIIEISKQALMLIIILSSPIIIATVLSGLLMSVLQSLFQIQDQALPFFIKLISSAFVIYATAPWLMSELLNFTKLIFQSMIEAGVQ